MSAQTPSMFDQYGQAKEQFRATPATVAPHHRATDPDSSKEAAQKHAASGNLTRNCTIVLSLLRAHPQSTYAELYDLASSADKELLRDEKEVARRLPDLQKLGFARTVTGGLMGQDIKRKCRVHGSSMRVWEANG